MKLSAAFPPVPATPEHCARRDAWLLDRLGLRHAGEAVSGAPLVCRPAELPERLAGLATRRITEVAIQPMGDIARGLTAFARAAGLQRAA